MHDFAATEKYTLYLDFPITLDMVRAIAGGPAIDFEPQYGSRIRVTPGIGTMRMSGGLMSKRALSSTLRMPGMTATRWCYKPPDLTQLISLAPVPPMATTFMRSWPGCVNGAFIW